MMRVVLETEIDGKTLEKIREKEVRNEKIIDAVLLLMTVGLAILTVYEYFATGNWIGYGIVTTVMSLITAGSLYITWRKKMVFEKLSRAVREKGTVKLVANVEILDVKD